MSLAQDRRRQRQREDLENLSSMLGIYQQFGPEQKARERMAAAQALAAEYGNEESMQSRAARMGMIDTQAAMAQLGLDTAKERRPYELEQLRAALESQQLGNARDAQLIPFVAPEAQTRLDAMKEGLTGARLQNKEAAQMGPLRVEGAALNNRVTGAQLAQEPDRRKYLQEQIRAMQEQSSYNNEARPVRMMQERAQTAAILNSLQTPVQATDEKGKPYTTMAPMFGEQQLRSVLGMPMQQMQAPGQQGGPTALDAILPRLIASRQNPVSDEVFGRNMGLPPEDGSSRTPVYHSLISAIQQNPGAGWTEQELRFYLYQQLAEAKKLQNGFRPEWFGQDGQQAMQYLQQNLNPVVR